MNVPPILFRSEKIKFTLTKKAKIINWLCRVADNERAEIKSLHFIFCSDSFLLSLNKKHLGHDYFTDVLTFDYSPPLQLERGSEVVGEIFISIPRVKDNAKKFRTTFENELQRVLLHGFLHLLGYSDKKKNQKETMRKKEEFYLKKV